MYATADNGGIVKSYEEVDYGSFTGIISSATAIPTFTLNYVQIGKLVTVSGSITIGATGTLSNTATVNSNGKLPSPSLDVYSDTGSNSPGAYIVRVNSLGNFFVYKRSPMDRSAALSYVYNEVSYFTFSYTTIQ